VETLIFIALGLFVFFIYFTLSIAVYEKFTKAKGANKLFWLIVLIATFSFLFGQGNQERQSSDYLGSSEDEYDGGYDYDTYDDNCSDFNSMNCDDE
jgi:hypothetical protein